MRKFLILASMFALAAPALAATNLIVNGDFEAGNTGFTTDAGYSFVGIPGPGAMVPEGTYTVATNAGDFHGSWASVTANTNRNFLIANGAGKSDAAVWKQTVTGLMVGQTYRFSGFAVNVCCNSSFGGPNASPIIIAARSGGLTSLATTGAISNTGVWQAFSGSFVASSTFADLSIFTDINSASGNDFGIDTLSLSAVPESATWAMMITGFGFIGAIARRRRSATAAITA